MAREKSIKNLRRSDYIRIALIAATRGIKTNEKYIGQVIRKDKPTYGSRGKGKIILEIANQVANENKQLEEDAKNAVL